MYGIKVNTLKGSKGSRSVSYISGSSEDLGEDDSCQAIPAVVQCGNNQLQKMVLVLQGAQVQQAVKTH